MEEKEEKFLPFSFYDLQSNELFVLGGNKLPDS